MLWDCSSCGTRNRGRDMRCTMCGSPKEDDERYVMPGDTSAAPSVTDPKRLAEARAGRNWQCPYCDGSVRNLYGECCVCGGPRTDRAVAGGPTIDLQGARGRPPDGPQFDSEGERRDLDQAIRRFRGGRWFWVSIVLGVLAVVGLFLLWWFLPHEVEVDVASIGWERTVELQRRQTNSGSDWRDQMAGGAFNVSCSTRQRGTENCHPYTCNCHQVTDYCSESCNCHEVCTDNGNGYASCSTECSSCQHECGSHEECDTCYEQCPVYADWCSYQYYTWPTLDRETTRGNDHAPYYSDRLLADPAANERLVYAQQFDVQFEEDDDVWNHRPETLEEFLQYDLHETWLIEVNHAGQVWPQHAVE